LAKKAFLLRISPELWEALNRWAADDFRSVNGQIEFLLRQAVEQRRRAKRAKRLPAAEDEGPVEL
jgi:hypothetical protein